MSNANDAARELMHMMKAQRQLTTPQVELSFRNERGEDVMIRVTDHKDVFEIQMQLGWRSTGEVRLWLTPDESVVLRDVLIDALGER